MQDVLPSEENKVKIQSCLEIIRQPYPMWQDRGCQVLPLFWSRNDAVGTFSTSRFCRSMRAIQEIEMRTALGHDKAGKTTIKSNASSGMLFIDPRFHNFESQSLPWRQILRPSRATQFSAKETTTRSLLLLLFQGEFLILWVRLQFVSIRPWVGT